MILLVMCLLTNVGLAVYGLVERPPDFASFMLAIFITNLMLYTMFYIVMKLRHGERILGQPLLYIILSSACWAAAMYFFVNKAVTWRVRRSHSSSRYNLPNVFRTETSRGISSLQPGMRSFKFLRLSRYLALFVSRQFILLVHGKFLL